MAARAGLIEGQTLCQCHLVDHLSLAKGDDEKNSNCYVRSGVAKNESVAQYRTVMEGKELHSSTASVAELDFRPAPSLRVKSDVFNIHVGPVLLVLYVHKRF